MSVKQLLNDIALNYLERKAQEELTRLRAIAKAAAVVAQDERVNALPGGKELVNIIRN